MDELFLRILNVSITAGWIVLAVVLLRLVLKKAPNVYRCILWAIVGLRLMWPFSIKSPISLIPSTQTIAPEQLYSHAPQIQSGIPAVDQVINPVFTQTFAPDAGVSINPLQIWLHIAGWVWVIGMVAMVTYNFVSFLRLRRQVRAAVRQEGNVYLCDAVESPFILGILRPRIYLPSSMDLAHMECVLAHERAHLKRKDHWWKPLGFALLVVYWFHPLLWVAYFLLCRDIEYACDEKVIADMDEERKVAYSETLLSCSIGYKRFSVCPLAFGEAGVKARIKTVLNYRKPMLWIVVFAVIVCVILALCSLTEPIDFPEKYLNQPTMKGLEVYVWEKSGKYYCGLMSGTNRNKTDAEIKALKPVSLETMNGILKTYDIPRDHIFVCLRGELSRGETGMSDAEYAKVYSHIRQMLGIITCTVDRESEELFSESDGQILRVQINGVESEYHATTQRSDDYQKNLYLTNLDIYEKPVWTYRRIYDVANDPDRNILVLVSNEGTEIVYLKQTV